MLCLAGCWTTQSQIKPPPHPETFVIPPEDDPRFSQPPQYPEKTLNQGLLKKDKQRKEDGSDDFRPPGRMPGQAGVGPGG
jgi:hypothetical protein